MITSKRLVNNYTGAAYRRLSAPSGDKYATPLKNYKACDRVQS
jgi:hypothetical protein